MNKKQTLIELNKIASSTKDIKTQVYINNCMQKISNFEDFEDGLGVHEFVDNDAQDEIDFMNGGANNLEQIDDNKNDNKMRNKLEKLYENIIIMKGKKELTPDLESSLKWLRGQLFSKEHLQQ